jgi:hypothetical protein
VALPDPPRQANRLEKQLQRETELPLGSLGAGDLRPTVQSRNLPRRVPRGARDGSPRIVKGRRVRQVKHLGAELQPQPLSQRERLQQRKIEIAEARTPRYVAPGIAEALVATAIGLFAAIPAVVAYNSNATEIDRLAIRFETFMEEFTNILQRQAAHR